LRTGRETRKMKVDVFNEEKVWKTSGEAVISLRTPRSIYKGLTDHLKQKFEAVLELRFHDVFEAEHRVGIYGGPVYTGMNEKQADMVVSFIQGRQAIVVHCDAGVSRSVAVGMFLRDYYKADVTLHSTWNDKLRNPRVYRLLQEANQRWRVAHGLPAVDPEATPSLPTMLEWEEELAARQAFEIKFEQEDTP